MSTLYTNRGNLTIEVLDYVYEINRTKIDLSSQF